MLDTKFLKNVLLKMNEEALDDFIDNCLSVMEDDLNDTLSSCTKLEKGTKFFEVNEQGVTSRRGCSYSDSKIYLQHEILYTNGEERIDSLLNLIEEIKKNRDCLLQRGIVDFISLYTESVNFDNELNEFLVDLKLNKFFKFTNTKDLSTTVCKSAIFGTRDVVIKYDYKVLLRKSFFVTDTFSPKKLMDEISKPYGEYISEYLRNTHGNLIKYQKQFMLKDMDELCTIEKGKLITIYFTSKVLTDLNILDSISEVVKIAILDFNKEEELKAFLKNVNAEDFTICKDMSEVFNIEDKKISFKFNLHDKSLRSLFLSSLTIKGGIQ